MFRRWRLRLRRNLKAHDFKELDFIINYDIKYRMGDELNAAE